jgi:hypothetical protein
MTQVLFTRNTITSQGKARIGDVLDLNEHEAKSLINYGRCVLNAGAPVQQADEQADEQADKQSINIDEIQDNGFDSDALENTSIGLESSDGEAVIRRGRPKKAK